MRLVWFVVAGCCLLAPLAATASTANVLVLYSNNRQLPANIEAEHALRETLASSRDRKVDLFAEFLDLPAFSGPSHEQTVATYLREKYATRPPDVIAVAGNGALEFMLRQRSSLFPGVPVIHMGIDRSFFRSRDPMPPGVVGIPVEYDYGGTIAQALRWHPHTRRLVVVTGASAQDREWEADVRSYFARAAHSPAIEYLSGLPTDDVLQRLRELGDGDLVFTPGYFADGAGRVFAPRDAAALMAAESGAPVYGPFVTFIGTGVVGGRMPTYAEMGRQAARTINDILAGTSPASLRMPASIPATLQVDWRQVRKWNIGADEIPDDAIVHFKAPSFWQEYRNTAIIIALVFLLQAALIAALLVERRLRHRTASALEDSEKRMNLAARAARISMWIWDVSRDRIWGATKVPRQPDVAQESPIAFDQVVANVHPADREAFERTVRHAVANGEEFEVEYRVLQPEGAVRWFTVRGRAGKGDGDRVMGVAMDITARKAAEVQAAKDRSALTHMSRVAMMGQLSAAIAHQLNQPLAAILGNAEAARKMLDKQHLDLAELKEICDDIVTEDNRAAEVIRRLGALYKRGEMVQAPLDLNELVRETLDLVRTELTTRQVVALTDLAPSLPPIDGGRVQLQQVLLNLILNAADAMSEVAPIQRTLTVSTGLEGANVRLCVADRGSGVAPENLKHVFEAFWGTKAGGIGVGLAICQSIVVAHGGALTVANNPGGGATFCATWPVRQHT